MIDEFRGAFYYCFPKENDKETRYAVDTWYQKSTKRFWSESVFCVSACNDNSTAYNPKIHKTYIFSAMPDK